MNPAATALPDAPPGILWGRSIAWLLFLGPFFFLSYGAANQFAAGSGAERSVVFAWEQAIPFLAWTIIPYWSIDLFYGLSFLCCRGRHAVDRHALRLLTAQLISVSCFVLFPLRFAFERPEADGVAGALFTALTQFDKPYNQAPSLHISLLVLIWAQFARLPVPPALRAVIHAWALLIGISVLTTWQHHFIDIPTGIAVGMFCLWIWPDHEPSPLAAAPRAAPRRWRLVLLYCAGSVALLAGSWAGGGVLLWLAWPSLSLALVAVNYAWAGAEGFQKMAGQHSLAVRWLLAPYLAGAWVNSRWWTRHHPQPDEIVDGIWLGRLPTTAEWNKRPFAALLDVTAELPSPHTSAPSSSLPWLDLNPVAPKDLLIAAERIEELRHHGPLLVACALGYSRSAAAVAAWLYQSRRADSIAAAVEMIRRQRPPIVLSNEWLQALAGLEALRMREAHA